MVSKMSVTHCIFDMDGLLLNTEDFYTIVQQHIAARYGKEFTWDLKAKMMGQKALAAAQVFVDELGLHGQLTPEQFLKDREHMLDEKFPESQFLPGVVRLLRHLKAHGVPICVATSSHARHFELKTARHQEVFGLFDFVVTGDMVTRGKPDPEIFQHAASRWDPEPEPGACLVFEDAPSGVAAAFAANMRVVMVPDANLARVQTLAATEVVSSLAEFQPEAYGLPPFPAE